jgi:hypothetical protein
MQHALHKHVDPSTRTHVEPEAHAVRVAVVLLACSAVGWIAGIATSDSANYDLAYALPFGVAAVGAALCHPGDWWAVVPFAYVVPMTFGWTTSNDPGAAWTLAFPAAVLILAICLVGAVLGAVVGWLVAGITVHRHHLH